MQNNNHISSIIIIYLNIDMDLNENTHLTCKF